MKTFFKISLVLFCVFCFSKNKIQGQTNIISRSSLEGSAIVLAWEPTNSASGYFIYRKEQLSGSYPTTPINSTKVSPLKNCAVIKNLLLTPDSTEWKIVAEGLSDTLGLFNPCAISTLSTTSEKYIRLLYLSAFNLDIAKVAGLAFEDATAINGQQYFYKIEAVDVSNNRINEVATDLSIVAGQVNLPDPPTGFEAESGDNDNLLLWETNHSSAAGYRIFRSITPDGVYKRVNKTDYSMWVNNRLNGDTLIPAKFGFLDFQEWDFSGNPIPREVAGNMINGPRNGYTYYYKIQAVDLLGRPGTMSSTPVNATPRDQTSPGIPDGISTIPDETTQNGSVEIRWRHVVFDVNVHLELPGVVGYKVYRFENTQDPNNTASVLVANVPVPISSSITQVHSTVDNSPGLRAQFGDKTWWYRIKAIDNAGNESNWSAAFKATLKDITQPEIPRGVDAEGFEEGIEVTWLANSEPDIYGYQIYRSYCHYGEWVPCPEPEEERPYDPECNPCEEEDPFSNNDKPKIPEPCSGPFIFLGEISADSLLRAIANNEAVFVDRTIPEGSPLCYAYWIKAIDKSGNMSGDFPFPNAEEQANIVCERMRDKTPPEAAIISGLFSRDRSIRVEWVAPPSQDIKAYHVYQAIEGEANVEPDINKFEWVGGMTVEQPPLVPIELNSPYEPINISACGLIPVQLNEEMSAGNIAVNNLDDHIVYWYKVTGIDHDGNETPLDQAVSASTFTFDTEPDVAPTIEFLATDTEPCLVRIEWFPIFDHKKHLGFLIYKSLKDNGPFIQSGSLIKTNTFQDSNVVKGQKYWYKIAILQHDGKISEVSTVSTITP